MQIVRDLSGRPRFYLDDADAEIARDANGKPVAARVGSDDESRKLADLAADWMAGRSSGQIAERRLLADLSPADVLQPAFQADFGIPAGDFVADVASPVYYVKQDRGYWYLENVADSLKLVVAASGGDGAASEVTPGYSSTLFTTVGYALAAKLPRYLLANADFDLKSRSTFFLVQALKLLREQRVATLLTTASHWATANQVAAVAKWNGGSNPAPLTDLFAALAASSIPANTLILPENAAQYFHYVPGTGAQVRDFVQGGGQLPRICYARARSSVAGANAYLWTPSTPANVALVRAVDPAVDLPSAATFRWLANGPDAVRSEGILVRSFFSSEDDAHWIVCTHNDVDVQISNQVGAVITGALA